MVTRRPHNSAAIVGRFGGSRWSWAGLLGTSQVGQFGTVQHTADTAMLSQGKVVRQTRETRHPAADRAMPSQRKEHGRRATRARHGFSLATAALPLVLLALLQGGLPARAFVSVPPTIGRWQSAAAPAMPMASRRRYRGSSSTAARESRPGDSSGGEAARSRGRRRHATAALSMGGSVEEEWPFHKSRSV